MFRIATFNLENLDEDPADEPGRPTFLERAALLRPALERLRADILCLQEVHGQERSGQPRDLLALRALLADTRYANHQMVSTKTRDGSQVYDVRNLVTLVPPGWDIREVAQINGEIVPNPLYQRTVAGDPQPRPLEWERPLLWLRVATPTGVEMHILNAHFKSKLATPAADLMEDRFTWKLAAGWAEGFFVSSMKRVGAALEARAVIDLIFDDDPAALILIAGDLNANSDEVPLMALRGRVEDTGNGALANRVMVPLEMNVPDSKRYTLIHHGKGEMIDHILASRRFVQAFSHTEIHNEILPDESVAFATDVKHPESDHAPVVAVFYDDLLEPPQIV
ncbi:endonuclease/exonuclease/phosphatase family protein (plasmid) [Paracoccus sp. TK19116]|uniref:Endonuclease/exonuclease/phosphatase family protein n=2 Tax=Paracoccus albicereus TaxID=2922394 RepID=A0ABT1MND2_9RHOB|nr:endonuclease/exonuclease/phosphatase family protein [Paracoccus albicereus]